ncbi:rRNA binding [Rhodosporidiobolus nylandii]
MFRTAFQPLQRALAPALSRRTASTASTSAATPLPPPASKYTLPKGLELKGQVISVGKMKNTITVSEFSKHTKYLVHDPAEGCVVGDQVKIRNCRPVSSRKRFELVGVTRGARERTESHHLQTARGEVDAAAGAQ